MYTPVRVYSGGNPGLKTIQKLFAAGGAWRFKKRFRFCFSTLGKVSSAILPRLYTHKGSGTEAVPPKIRNKSLLVSTQEWVWFTLSYPDLS